MPAQCRAGIPLTSDPPRAMSVGNADARLVVPPTATGGRSGLLDFFFGLIGILLLFLQVCCGGWIRGCGASRIFLAPPPRSGGNFLFCFFFPGKFHTICDRLAGGGVHFFES